MSAHIRSSSLEKPLVVVVTGYNVSSWAKRNLDSIFSQKYTNYRVIYIEDCSTDNTAKIVEQYIQEHGLEDRVTLIKNTSRCYKLKNIYNAYHSIDDWDIIVQVDGDDWLADNQVFQKINRAYSQEEVWITYGQFKKDGPDGRKRNKVGYCAPVPSDILFSGKLREWNKFVFMHLRTFYAWLFKSIKLEDFLTDAVPGFKGQFYPYANDVAMMFPMIEMACRHYKCFSDVLYILNRKNPNSGVISHRELQVAGHSEILNNSPYTEITKPIIGNLKQLDEKKLDCLILSQDSTKLDFVLRSLESYVQGVDGIIVFYENTNNNNDFSELKKEFSNVIFFELSAWSQEELKEILSVLLEELGDYLLLGTDTFGFLDTVDCKACIKRLEQTYAHGCYFSLNKELITEENPCYQHLFDDYYAGKFKFINYDFDAVSMALYRKKDIVSSFLNLSTLGLSKCIERWEDKKAIENNVGLFFNKPKAISLL